MYAYNLDAVALEDQGTVREGVVGSKESTKSREDERGEGGERTKRPLGGGEGGAEGSTPIERRRSQEGGRPSEVEETDTSILSSQFITFVAT
mmetsp:Transcript_4212/g.8503  ORF Transcript_4212/g.8503 Transcript_4212/m.8503 type:complete len:92 (-) Transcript_4212:345-620(-)